MLAQAAGTIDVGLDAEAAVARLTASLAAQGVRCSRTFDSRPSPGPACPAACLQQAGPGCDCRLAVLLAYPEAGPPLSITAVGVGDRTRFRIDPAAGEVARTAWSARIRAALAGASAELASPEPLASALTE
jgi:hypothetical protein